MIKRAHFKYFAHAGFTHVRICIPISLLLSQHRFLPPSYLLCSHSWQGSIFLNHLPLSLSFYVYLYDTKA